MALEQSIPEFESWQPGLGGGQLILAETRAFFLKIDDQIEDPAEHSALMLISLHAFNDDIWESLRWESVPSVTERTILLGMTSEAMPLIPRITTQA